MYRALFTALLTGTVAAGIAALALAAGAAGAATPPAPLPERLSQTGFGRPGAVAFAPRYPLWSDGAAKRRWLMLPPGTSIDARDADAWRFPRGTKLWKEFAVDGRPVETRFIERQADGSWRFAAYVWDADGRDATLAPEAGTTVAVAGAPGGRYAVPSRLDCLACHESTDVPVLGASALQLSDSLRHWVADGRLRGLPTALLDRPPSVAAGSDLERAALGLLHGNCGHCHNRSGRQVPVDLSLQQRIADGGAASREATLASLAVPGRWRPGGVAAPIADPGHADRSPLVQRMATRNPQVQMPPLGTRVPDADGLAVVRQWIDHDLPNRKEPAP